jgi:ubiquitin-activating enzyme E1 C
LWPKENPFSDHANGDSIAIDGDDPQHITWIYEKALERSNTVSNF